MSFALPPLPYALNALEPHVSAPTLALHHGRHFAGHLLEVNRLVRSTTLVDERLEDVVQKGWGALREHASLAWNHRFFFQCMRPGGGGDPPEALRAVLEDRFGSLERFKDTFTDEAVRLVGSGFVWLVVTADGSLYIDAAQNGECPLREVGTTPLLCLDVWEHAYYLDHQDDRERYARTFWSVVDWRFAEDCWRARPAVPGPARMPAPAARAFAPAALGAAMEAARNDAVERARDEDMVDAAE